MQIVIEIPEEEYDYLKARHAKEVFYGDAIAKGTPLPKHHGRLIDADKLRAKFNFPDWGICVQEKIDATPTIVEATRVEE